MTQRKKRDRYPLSEEDKKRLENNFTYHPPQDDQIQRYQDVRNLMKKAAREIMESCPPSRERSIALTKLDEAVMWANAAIARNE